MAALVGAEGAEDAIRALAAAARRANPGGNGGRVFEGSGPGGFEFGRLVLRCDETSAGERASERAPASQ